MARLAAMTSPMPPLSELLESLQTHRHLDAWAPVVRAALAPPRLAAESLAAGRSAAGRSAAGSSAAGSSAAESPTTARAAAEPPAAAELLSKLPRALAETPHGNLRDALEASAPDAAQRRLLSVALAVALLGAAGGGSDGWLEQVRRAGRGAPASETSGAEPLALQEPLGVLEGEEGPVPRAAWRTAVLAFTGWLALAAAGRLGARWALGLRRPTRLALDATSLVVSTQTLLLGRPLRSRQMVCNLAELGSITREVRYARAGTYAGLAALTVGTYFGIGLMADGARVVGGSPPLLLAGLGLVVAGLGLDFVLTSLLDTQRRTCRVVVRPARGRPACVGSVDPTLADRLLREVARRLAERAEAGSSTARSGGAAA